MIKIGDLVTTSFYPKDASLIREVIDVSRYKGASESGWKITTKDRKGRTLSADMNWYKKAT